MKYSLNSKEMGRRLSIVRIISDKELNEAAKSIGLAANRLASAERGSISLETHEVNSLAHLYGISPVRFIAHSAVHTDLVPRFKNLSKFKDCEVFEAVRLMNNLFSAEAELENMLGTKHPTKYPKALDIDKGDIKDLATEHAYFLREYLGVGNNPIPDIFSIIGEKLGIRLFQRKLENGSKILGMFAFDENHGACILLNANYPRPSRVLAAAHELGHFVANRKKIDILKENGQGNSKDELYAINFSYAFTMPEESFSESFNEISGVSNELSKEIAVELANWFHVPVADCVRRLDELALVKDAMKWYESVREIETSEERRILGDEQYRLRHAAVDDAEQILPNRIGLLMHKVWNAGLASESYLASVLNLGLIEVREVYYSIENGIPVQAEPSKEDQTNS